jgi:cell division transport system permease protein
MRPSFVVNEIGIGLRRNLTMTISLILTSAIASAALLTALLIRSEVQYMQEFWLGKVEVSIFLCGKDSDTPSCASGEVTDTQRSQIEADLRSNPNVKTVYYETKQQAYEKYKIQFKGTALADNVTADQLPESFRVKLKDPNKFAVVSSAFTGRPGVETVFDSKEIFDRILKLIRFFQFGAWAVAIVTAVVSILLIGNTVLISAFSRRRETGIMRLVGASNLSIQLPFILEGAIGALFGGIIGVGLVALVMEFAIYSYIKPSFRFIPWIEWGPFIAQSPLVLVAAVLLAVVTSFVTLLRYLRI